MKPSERVWEELEGRYGHDLRAVIRYHPTGYEAHMRDGLREQYSDQQVQSFADEAIVNQIQLESKVEAVDFGPFHGVVRIFDDAWVFIWPDSLDGKSGFLVTLERTDSAVGLDAIEEIDTYLSEEIDPSKTQDQSV